MARRTFQYYGKVLPCNVYIAYDLAESTPYVGVGFFCFTKIIQMEEDKQMSQALNTGMQKIMIFKNRNSGTSKKTGNSYDIVTLHDPDTLENIDCFIRNHEVLTDGIDFKDEVIATFGMDIIFGKPQMVLTAIHSI